jgi:ATP-dependent protease HslVU (ClpYQ) peptidase subunit
MTTVLADVRFGLMVADSNITDTHKAWKIRKVYRIGGSLVGMAGNAEEFLPFLVWCRAGMQEDPPKLKTLEALILSSAGLLHYSMSTLPIRIGSGRHAIGSGSMAALAVYEALGFCDPRRAVHIACKHDAGSRGPVRVYKL